MSNSIRKSIRQLLPRHFRQSLRRLFPDKEAAQKIAATWRREGPTSPPHENASKPGLGCYEYSWFSQNGEDGILAFLFSEIGFESRRFLEFGFGAYENNCMRLVLRESFNGIFIDGSSVTVGQFNEATALAGLADVKAVEAFLDLDNLETKIRDSGLSGEIDLLSIDVDGNDYWFWERIDCISPRIVIVEYNAAFGDQRSVTVLYDPQFDRCKKHDSRLYFGTSLEALRRLAIRKGYTLVGVDTNGVNAFFVRNDCLTEKLRDLANDVSFRDNQYRVARGMPHPQQFEQIRHLPLAEIS